MLVGPPSVDVNATCPPSGDHNGDVLFRELTVKREVVPRSRSYIQMSDNPVWGSTTPAATELPYGEIEILPNNAGKPTVPTVLPDRSIQVSWEFPPPASDPT